jgi:hypothetical protein
MATTTNFGWVTPDNTDLVKDGASAIRTLGSSIDSSMGDLKGGTTGQVLSKTTGTDMDFTWVTTDDTNAIQNAIVDAKGDLIAATAADTPARLAVGANDTMLVGDSTAATGLSYKSAATLYPWQAYSPTYNSITIGNGTVTARYQQIGKLVNVYWKLVWGSTTSFTSYPRIYLPVAPSAQNDNLFNGVTYMLDVSAGALYSGPVWSESNANEFQPMAANSSATYLAATYLAGNTVPFTWTTSDVMLCRFSYEAS